MGRFIVCSANQSRGDTVSDPSAKGIVSGNISGKKGSLKKIVRIKVAVECINLRVHYIMASVCTPIPSGKRHSDMPYRVVVNKQVVR